MSLKRRFLYVLVLVFSLLCLAACVKTEKASIPEGEDELPDMIMRGATYTYGDKNRNPLTMEAKEITIYSGKKGRTLMENVSFVQLDTDENGQSYVDMEGYCDSVYISEDNSVAKMNGNVHLVKKSDNFEIDCDSLEWNDDDQIIKTNDTVKVRYEDGTSLVAIGFSAQLNNNIYEFGEIVEGRYTDEK